MYNVGVCLEKKPRIKKIGIKNQYMLLLVLTLKIKQNRANIEKKAA
tara:strand:+ start:329 stop:466 length:138 start_codon:yes stop_codon:yes gene_type:complete